MGMAMSSFVLSLMLSSSSSVADRAGNNCSAINNLFGANEYRTDLIIIDLILMIYIIFEYHSNLLVCENSMHLYSLLGVLAVCILLGARIPAEGRRGGGRSSIALVVS